MSGRLHKKRIEVKTTMLASLRERGKRLGRGRWFVDAFSGWEFWRNGRRMVRKMRRLDREGDWYDEVVTDPQTGEIIHECHEPLSEHRPRSREARTPTPDGLFPDRIPTDRPKTGASGAPFYGENGL